MEQEAKDWAKQCKFSLGPPGVAGYGTGNKYGQNIWARRLDESNHTAIGDKDAWRHYNSFIHEDDEVELELENYGIPQLNELDPDRRRLRGVNNTLRGDGMTDEERHFDRSHSMTADDIVEDHDQDLAKSK